MYVYCRGEALVLVPSAYERSKACALRSWVKGTNTTTSPYIKTEVYNRGDGPNAFIWTLKISLQKGSLTLGWAYPSNMVLENKSKCELVDLGLEIFALANLSPPGYDITWKVEEQKIALGEVLQSTLDFLTQGYYA